MSETNDVGAKRRTRDFRVRLAHPLIPGKRVSLSAHTQAELDAMAARVRSLGADVALGVRTPSDATAALERLLRGPASRQLGVVAARYFRDAEAARGADAVRAARGVWSSRLALALSALDVAELSRARLDAWERDLVREDYAHESIKAAFGVLRRVVASSLAPGEAPPWGVWTPSAKAARPRRVREKAHSAAELAALVRAAGARDEAVVRMTGGRGDLAWRVVAMALLGLRGGEGAALAWDQFTVRGDAVVLTVDRAMRRGWSRALAADEASTARPSSPPKNGTHAHAVHPLAVLVLLFQREALERAGLYDARGPVFPARDTGRWRARPELVHPRIVRALAKAAGLPNAEAWTQHSLRHSAAALETAAGASLDALQARLGWSSAAIAAHYAKKGDRYLPESVIEGADEARRAGGRADAFAIVERTTAPAALSLVGVVLETYALLERAREAFGARRSEARASVSPRVLAGEIAERRVCEAFARELRTVTLAELARWTETPPAPLDKATRRVLAVEVKRREARASRQGYAAGLRDDREVARRLAVERRAAFRRVWSRAKARARALGRAGEIAPLADEAQGLARTTRESGEI